MPRLIVESGPAIGREVALRDGVRFGRLESCTLALADDNNVSREHAEIRLTTEGFLVHDLGSRNGTLVNGRRVEEARLNPGDRITIGDTTLLYVDDAAPASMETTRVRRSSRRADSSDSGERGEPPAAAPVAPPRPEPAATASETVAAAEADADETETAPGPGEPQAAVERQVAELGLLALLLVLTFLCASYATQVALRWMM